MTNTVFVHYVVCPGCRAQRRLADSRIATRCCRYLWFHLGCAVVRYEFTRGVAYADGRVVYEQPRRAA